MQKLETGPGLIHGAVLLGDTGEWPMFRGNPARTGVSGEVLSPPLEQKWKTRTHLHLSSPVVSAGIVYVGSPFGVDALDAETGEPIWKTELWGGMLSSPAVVGDAVCVAAVGGGFGTFSGRLHVLDAHTGTRRAELKTVDSKWDGISSPVAAHGSLYVGITDKVLAVDIDSWSERWIHDLADSTSSSPAFAQGVVYVGCDDKQVHALDAATGEERWAVRIGGTLGVRSTPAVFEDTVYAASMHGSLFALDRETGAPRWEAQLGWIVDNSPAVTADTVFIGSKKTLIAIDRRTGARTWEHKLSPFGTNLDDCSPVVSGETVFLGAASLQTQDLTLLPGPRLSGAEHSPALAGGTLFVPCDDGTLYAYIHAET